MFLSNGGIIENLGHPQGILFLEVALTENWLIFVTREAHTWPSWQLVGAILGVEIIATLFCVFGWLTGGAFEQTNPSDPATFSEGPTSIVTVIVVWGFSIGVIIFIATVYYLLSRITWLQILGRASRSKEKTKMERFLEQLFKLTVEREKDPQSENPRYVLKTRTEDFDADD